MTDSFTACSSCKRPATIQPAASLLVTEQFRTVMVLIHHSREILPTAAMPPAGATRFAGDREGFRRGTGLALIESRTCVFDSSLGTTNLLIGIMAAASVLQAGVLTGVAVAAR